MKVYQQQVVDERLELQKRIDATQTFVHGSAIRGLDVEEQQRIELQLELMKQLERVLAQRIQYFLENAE